MMGDSLKPVPVPERPSLMDYKGFIPKLLPALYRAGYLLTWHEHSNERAANLFHCLRLTDGRRCDFVLTDEFICDSSLKVAIEMVITRIHEMMAKPSSLRIALEITNEHI